MTSRATGKEEFPIGSLTDPIVIGILAIIVLLAVWRFRRTYRDARQDREAEIARKLEALRRKRDGE